MNKIPSFQWLHCLFARAGLQMLALALTAGFGSLTARADMASITKNVWKMQYGVTDAQIMSSVWLAADDDGDGVINGDEIASGTHPFVGGSVVKITDITADTTTVSLTFPAVMGKQYVVQGSPNLTNFTTLSPSVFLDASSTSSQTLSAPKGANLFFRVLVQDHDADNDGASDWAETVAGYNPNSAADGGAAVLGGAIASSDVVTVIVTKPNALQPLAGFAPIETGSITISRGGPLKFHSITVPLQKSGTATEGTDYDSLPNSVTFPVGVSEVVLAINPKANASRKTNVTAIVKALTGGSLNYTLGANTSGSVVINPAGIANGAGLTAQYQNTANSSYSSQTPIFATAAEMTRTDATVDFTSGVNGWGTVGGPTGLSPASTTGAFSVRWTGQILPQFSETYTIDFRSDDGAKVWVNGVLLIDRWNIQTANDYTNTIALQAGTLYDIQIEYFNNGTGSAEAKLYWWSASQVKQIIPQVRLFPAPTQANKTTAITSSLTAVGFEGTPFNFSVMSPNIGGAGTSYALAANSGLLPLGLSLNSSTGAITGTPTTAGIYNVAIDATNVAAAAVAGSSIVNITIYPVGAVSREILTASGPNVSDIVVPSPSVTPAHDTIATVDDDAEYDNNTGERLRGYLVPPKTGNYYFWIAANNAAELWISNDSEYVNRVKRASLTTNSGKKVWNTTPTQQTAWLSLVAGERYYFEVLHNTGGDVVDDYVAVGWCQDDLGTVPAVIGAPNSTGAVTLLPNGGGPLQGYPLSGTVPGYIFQPYDYPAVAPSTGSLYACNIGPQASAITSASGSANIQVNAGETQAILRFAYQNLTTPKTSYHLHVDGFTGDDLAVHPQGEIIYDIDDADQNPSEQTGDGGYIWDFRAVGSFSPTQLREALHKGKVYINIHSVSYPNGEIRGTFGLIDGSQTPPEAASYAAPVATDDPTNAAHAARFLNQATFGASPADVAVVQGSSFQAWITGQLSKPASRTSNDVVAGLTADINTPYPSSLFTDAWWKNSITGQDQLRQRLAFALSEIMVVSWANNTGPLQSNGRILADYYDQLVDYCLPTAGLTDSGNFRGILKQVTLTPAMGLYLDMRANQKGDDTIGRHPNENYAREIMQLFSVGIYRTWDDGRFVLGSDAGLVSTYTQPSIIGLSNLFTGWNYAQPNLANGRAPTNFGPGADYLNPMVLVPSQHELSSKFLLNNVNSPAATGRTPRVAITSVTGSPCTINTTTIHGLKVGDTIKIANVAAGTFSAPINASHQVTEIVDADSFKVAINLISGTPTYTNATVTGATVKPAAILGAGGIAAVTGSQADSVGTTIPHPYDQYGLKELELAIDNIVNNDNVPPYICRQLIQRLVTSDPSPGYIYRVVQKFKNNGSGVRGDLAAVVSQILLDGEARSSSVTQNSTTFGKQREPMLRLTAPARAFPAANYTGTYTQLTGVNSNKFRIVTSAPNDFSSGFTVSLNFRGNYVTPMPSVPNPANNPTSTAYGISTTLGIAGTHTDISSIGTGNPTVITTTQPHGLVNNDKVSLTGVSGTFVGTNINTASQTVTVLTPTSFSIPINTTLSFQVASISTGSPCTVTTTTAHGLSSGNSVTLNGIGGGAFSPAINATFTVTVTGANTFTVASNCTSPPTSYTIWREVSNPCRVTTQVAHGLITGDSITISGVNGTTTPSINSTYTITVLDSTSFLVPGVNCTAAATLNTGNIVGGNTMDVAATGMVNVTYTQPAGSNVMTVNTGGPATDIAIPVPNSATTTLKSKVYLDVLTRNSTASIASIATGNPCTITTVAAHGLTNGDLVAIASVSGGTFSPAIANTYAVTVLDGTQFTVLSNCTVAPTAATGTITGNYGATAADGVYAVQTTNGGTSFTVATADTPTAARSGNVIVPKIATSYTPLSSNTIVQFNNNVNHNMVVGQNVWVDVPVVGSPLTDAEYIITETADEDHFKTSYLPVSSGLGTYPKPSGSNNGVTLYPLVPPPMGRSGSIVINQSTYNLGSTEGSITQSPLNAPTVFNYFFPDYKFPGTLANSGLDSPEFQLTTDTNVMNLTNSLTNMIIGTGGGNSNLNGLSSFNNGSGTVVMNIEPYMTNAKTSDNGIPALIDELADLLVGAPLVPSVKTKIQKFVTGKRITAIGTGSPCAITSAGHGLTTGNSVTISGVTGGTFSPTINGTFSATVTGPDTFTVPVNCTSISGVNLTNAGLPVNFPMTSPTPTNLQKRDRVRAIIHLIITSAEFAVQK
ncbi:MAG: DUF1800 family protein [Prosthecobacter sp.]